MKMTAFCTLGYVAINTKVLAFVPSFFFLHCLTKYYQNLLKSGGKYEYLQSFGVPYFQENLLKSYSTCSNIQSPVFESVMYIHSVGLFLVGLHRYPYCKENLHFRRTTFVRCHLNDIGRTFSASVRGCQVLLFKSDFLQLKRLLKMMQAFCNRYQMWRTRLQITASWPSMNMGKDSRKMQVIDQKPCSFALKTSLQSDCCKNSNFCAIICLYTVDTCMSIYKPLKFLKHLYHL